MQAVAPRVGLERMLRIHFLQQWYALSDPAIEEALYDSSAMRRFDRWAKSESPQRMHPTSSASHKRTF